jgi:hypothetical protein
VRNESGLKEHPDVEVPRALLSAVCREDDEDESVRVAAAFLVMLAGREPVGSAARKILLRAADPLLEALQPRSAGLDGVGPSPAPIGC